MDMDIVYVIWTYFVTNQFREIGEGIQSLPTEQGHTIMRKKVL